MYVSKAKQSNYILMLQNRFLQTKGYGTKPTDNGCGSKIPGTPKILKITKQFGRFGKVKTQNLRKTCWARFSCLTPNTKVSVRCAGRSRSRVQQGRGRAFFGDWCLDDFWMVLCFFLHFLIFCRLVTIVTSVTFSRPPLLLRRFCYLEALGNPFLGLLGRVRL